MSHLFGQTLRRAPAEIEVESHKLLLRGAFVRRLGAGIFTWLPLGRRVVRNVCGIIREEMEAIGAQEMSLPVVNPAEIWKATGRWSSVGSELTRFSDRNDRDLVLAMTHEEAVARTVADEISSYRQLPRLIYHIQTKWRDDPRPRAGLIRVREFTMKDSYSLDADEAGLDGQYRNHLDAYRRIFDRCGIDTLSVESDVGMMGGQQAHEFMYVTPVGEDALVRCTECDFRANREIARFARRPPEDAKDGEVPGEVKEVHTPGARTIEALAEFLGVSRSRTAKMVFLMDERGGVAKEVGGAGSDRGAAGRLAAGDAAPGPGSHATGSGYAAGESGTRLIAALVRGDREVNETKLSAVLGGADLRPALDEEIRAAGAVPGYAAPGDLTGSVTVVVDEGIPISPNLVTGANREDYHRLNMSYGRDFAADLVADIASARDGDPCPGCGAPMSESRAVEVGNIFKLGTIYSEALDCHYLDENGERRPVVMGSYGIGVGRLIACIAEEHRDERGLCWPVSVAPFAVQIVALKGGEEEAAALYDELSAAGFDTLLDDREGERPGSKFADADLIGAPVRVTVSGKRVAASEVEIKARTAVDAEVVAQTAAVDRIRELLSG